MSYYRTIEHRKLRAELIHSGSRGRSRQDRSRPRVRLSRRRTRTEAQRGLCCANSGGCYKSKMRVGEVSGSEDRFRPTAARHGMRLNVCVEIEADRHIGCTTCRT